MAIYLFHTTRIHPTAWKLATLRMLLKSDKLLPLPLVPGLSALSVQLMMKLFERLIEQRLRCHLEQIGFINRYQSGFRQAEPTDCHLFRLFQSVIENFYPILDRRGGGGGQICTGKNQYKLNKDKVSFFDKNLNQVFKKPNYFAFW